MITTQSGEVKQTLRGIIDLAAHHKFIVGTREDRLGGALHINRNAASRNARFIVKPCPRLSGNRCLHIRRLGGGRFGLKEFQSCAAMNANQGVIIVTILTNGTKLH
jgi:hypothetical protein